MEREQWEHLSILIETTAFFLVTIDLYGKERLSLLRTKLISLNSLSIKNRLKNIAWIIYTKWYFFLIVIVIIQIFIHYIIINFYSREIISLHEKGMPIKDIDKRLNIAITTSAIILYILFNFMLLVPYYLVTFAQKISKLFPIEGVMLTIGAILFIISKVIAYRCI